jgi:hypothetical protein
MRDHQRRASSDQLPENSHRDELEPITTKELDVSRTMALKGKSQNMNGAQQGSRQEYAY